MKNANLTPSVRMTPERFAGLWETHTLATRQSDSRAVYDELWCRYCEGHRRYHTTAHIDYCLAQLDLAEHLMGDADAVEMAIWFHDVIYDPGASDNEHQSAEWFVELAEGYLDPAFVDRVRKLILATIPGRFPQSLDEEFVVDIDLSSFASPWPLFKRDSLALREEFTHLTDKSFFAAQLEFYQSLLERPGLYFTPFFHERMEYTAIQNIRRYMKELSTKGDI